MCFPKVSQGTVAKEVSQCSHQTLHPCRLFRCLSDLWDIFLSQQRAIQKLVQIPWTRGEVEQESTNQGAHCSYSYLYELGINTKSKKTTNTIAPNMAQEDVSQYQCSRHLFWPVLSHWLQPDIISGYLLQGLLCETTCPRMTQLLRGTKC